MLHRRHVRIGEGRWRGNWADAARKRRENHGDRGSPRIATLGQYLRGESSRSHLGAAELRVLHDRSETRETTNATAIRYFIGISRRVNHPREDVEIQAKPGPL